MNQEQRIEDRWENQESVIGPVLTTDHKGRVSDRSVLCPLQTKETAS
jgi:hypothetical protein